MKARLLFAIVVCCGLLLAASVLLAQAQPPAPEGRTLGLDALGTSFSYQGRLLVSGKPLSGTCDLQFALWDAETGGAQVGSTATETAVDVSDGLFTVWLDFGAAPFGGDARWLEISVRSPAGSGDHTLLSPRQPLTAVPYALYAKTAPWSGIAGVPSGLADGVDDDTLYSAGAGLALVDTTFQVVFAGSGGADTAARSDHQHDGSYWKLTGNAGTAPGTNLLGTTDNQALELWVNNARALRLEPHAISPNVIAGYSGNSVAAGKHAATISGGGYQGNINRVLNDYGTVGGGYSNTVGFLGTVGGGYGNIAGPWRDTVAGGCLNTADGMDSAIGGGTRNRASGMWSVIGGGDSNTASEGLATVGGGRGNTASEWLATVGGGETNSAAGERSTIGGGEFITVTGRAATVAGGSYITVSGDYAAVPGGQHNVAQGNYSLAAGRRAKAVHAGSFVWADSTSADITSTAQNQFIVRAAGGIWLGTTSAPGIPAGRFLNTSTGAYLSSGGAWTNNSDQNRKENFAPVERRAVLERLATVPINTWNYTAQDPSIRHMGPTAQDLYAAFALGEDEAHISTVDAEGISLAAVQALYELSQEQAARIEELERRLAALETAPAQLAQQGTRGEP